MVGQVSPNVIKLDVVHALKQLEQMHCTIEKRYFLAVEAYEEL